MSEGGYGLGDGMYNLSNLPGLADAKEREAHVPKREHIDAARWPSVGSVLHWSGLALLGLVVAGWILAALAVFARHVVYPLAFGMFTV
jgi:hypothetical protein